jgi:CheY-like chemotaxis protein
LRRGAEPPAAPVAADFAARQWAGILLDVNPDGVNGGPPVSAPRHRVFVIDDEPMMGRAIRRLLGADHDVTTTTDPRAAVEQVRAGARFDAILCDLLMPAMNGMQVYEEIGRVDEDQAHRIVFMTGGTFGPHIARFLGSIRNPRIDKPLDKTALRAILRSPSVRQGGT